MYMHKLHKEYYDEGDDRIEVDRGDFKRIEYSAIGDKKVLSFLVKVKEEDEWRSEFKIGVIGEGRGNN